MPNPTMTKFGYPGSLVAETGRWAVLLRPRQPTLGSLVLVAKDEAASFSALGAAAFSDLRTAVAGIERTLAAFVRYERINYLMLMMVDPDVHFHVVPRYWDARSHGGVSFPDAGWPGPPLLDEAVAPEPALAQDIRARLAALWSAS